MSQYSVTPENESPNPDIDPTKYEQLMNDLKSGQNLPMAILGGLIASVTAAVIWAIITYLTGYKTGFVAIGVGILVGLAVKYLGKGMTLPFGIVGALFALLGCILGNLFTTIIFASLQEGVPLTSIGLSLLTTPQIIIEVMIATFQPMDLLFYGIAIYEGFRFSIRQISEEEYESVRKSQTPPPPTNFEEKPKE